MTAPAPTAAPRRELEAEAAGASLGVMSVAGGAAIGYLDDGDWLSFPDVDFGTGAANQLSVTLALPVASAGQRLEVRLDTPDGTLLGTLTTASTGSWEVYVAQAVTLAGASGRHALVVVGRGSADIGNIERFVLNGL